jgi:methylase of polypeptide subunit release factors
MPSHPIHSERREQDFYSTPEWCTKVLLDAYPLSWLGRFSPPVIVEPCAGSGAISKVIKQYYPDCKLIQYEIRSEEEQNLKQYGELQIIDFLKVTEKNTNVNYVITNPPFSLAKEFIEHSHYLYPFANIIMLLPLTLYGSAKRYNFWKKFIPASQWILTDRPSFTGHGSDSSVYCWIGWKTSDKGFFFLKNNYKKVK